MKVLLTDTNCTIDETIELDTLEDLLAISKKYNNQMLVIKPPWQDDSNDFEIEIYNGYRE